MPPTKESRKREIVIEYQRRVHAHNFVETGTAIGDMCDEVAPHFQRVVTIEKHCDIAKAASLRLLRHANVAVVLGDSGMVLGRVLPFLLGPTMFWLDAHDPWQSKSAAHCPLLQELDAIARHVTMDTVILIDDVRLFGNDGWPTMDEVLAKVGEVAPAHTPWIEEDILRVTT